MLQLDQISHLRLAVAVPEADVARTEKGVRVEFKAPEHPERTFSGVIARLIRALDMKTRTTPLELDRAQQGGAACSGNVPVSLVSVRSPTAT